MGEIPEWYRLLRAAKYLGVPPWDLADRPVWWLRVALAAQGAEANAAEQQEKRAARKKKG